MIRQLPGGGLASGISSVMPERDEEAAALMWNSYMDQIRRRGAMRTRPVRAAMDTGDHHAAAVARVFLAAVDADERRSAALAEVFLGHLGAPVPATAR